MGSRIIYNYSEKKKMGKEIEISVIIPVFNNAAGLTDTLQSVLQQDYPRKNFEIIVIDNKSTDETLATAREFERDFPAEIVVLEENTASSSYAARNKGIQQARGEIVAFIDADMTVEAVWLSKIENFFKDPQVEYLGNNVEIRVKEDSLFSLYNQLTGFPVKKYIETNHFAPCCCLVVRRTLFDQIGYFDPRLVSCGDQEFGNRVFRTGRKLYFDPENIMSHPARFKLKQLLKKYWRIGRGFAQLCRYYEKYYAHIPKTLLNLRSCLPENPVHFLRLAGRAETWEGFSKGDKAKMCFIHWLGNVARYMGYLRERGLINEESKQALMCESKILINSSFMNGPKITVLMPVYNRERYVREAIESILRQTFSDFEFLIIDDGSTDQTINIVHSFSDPRIRLIQNAQHEGIWKSVNRGLRVARGEYLARMDSDDIALPQRLEKQSKHLDQNPDVEAVASTILSIDADGNDLPNRWEAEKNNISYHQIKEAMIRTCCICNPTTMVRTKILKKYLFNEKLNNNGADYEMWLHFCSDNIPIHKIPEPLLKFREHAQSETFYYKHQHKNLPGQQAKKLRIKIKMFFLLRRLRWGKWNQYTGRVFVQIGKDIYQFCRMLLEHFYKKRGHLFSKRQGAILLGAPQNAKNHLLVTLADENYIEQAKQVFSSAYFNAGWDGDYMLLAHDIPEEKLKWFEGKKILIKRCKPLYHKTVGGMSPTLPSKFYLFTPEFKKWKTVIYIDADTTLMASLDGLKNVSGFAAVEDGFYSTLEGQIIIPSECEVRGIELKQYNLTRDRLTKQYNLKKRCFCAGFFVFDTHDCIQDNTFANLNAAYQEAEKFNRYGEQLTWNLFFYGRWKKLPPVYNICMDQNRNQWRIKPKALRAIALHYTGPKKPWKNGQLDSYYRELWKHNLARADQINLGEKIQGQRWPKWKILCYSGYLNFRMFFVTLIDGIECWIGKFGIWLRKTNPDLYFFLKELLSRKTLHQLFHEADRVIGQFGKYLRKQHPHIFKTTENKCSVLLRFWRNLIKKMPRRESHLSTTLAIRYLARSGSLPDYIIIGAIKGGTTSLYKYLCQHPDIISSTVKETRYFSQLFSPYGLKSLRWYKAFFPSEKEKKGKITGEASPIYFIDSKAPRRIKETVPDSKLILLLRNPVERTYSHYQMNKNQKRIPEQISFHQIVEETIFYQGAQKQKYAYLVEESFYAKHIKNWLSLFPKEQLLIIKSEDFFSNTPQIMAEVFDFLGLQNHNINDYEPANKGAYQEKISPQTRQLLEEYFRPHNEELYCLIGRDMGWENEAIVPNVGNKEVFQLHDCAL